MASVGQRVVVRGVVRKVVPNPNAEDGRPAVVVEVDRPGEGTRWTVVLPEASVEEVSGVS